MKNAEAQQASAEIQAEHAAVAEIAARSPAPAPIVPYKPRYSAKIVADNGAVYAIDLNTARHFANGVEAGVYDEGRGGIIPTFFDCHGHMRDFSMDGGLVPYATYLAPLSIGAQLSAIACAEADRHPERR